MRGIVALFVFLQFSAQFVYACSVLPFSARQHKAGADVVFRGVITDMPYREIKSLSDILEFETEPRVVVFRVNRVWKGAVAETFQMPAIENPGGVCIGFRPGLLKVGNELLVYASRVTRGPEFVYVTSIDSATLAKDSKDFRELGRGRAPRKTGQSPRPSLFPLGHFSSTIVLSSLVWRIETGNCKSCIRRYPLRGTALEAQ